MTVAELIEQLQALPSTLEVMLPAEAGVDHASTVRVVAVTKTQRDWSGTPVGNFRELADDSVAPPVGDPFTVAVISF